MVYGLSTITLMDQKNLTSIQRKLQILKQELSRQYTVSEMYVFGSVVTGSAHQASDVDVAVISSEFGQDYWKETQTVERIAQHVDDAIEVHLFHPRDFTNPYDSMATAIRAQGIKI